jgi:hypothetical protein
MVGAPWYPIGADFIEGCCYLPALLVAVAVAAAWRRRDARAALSGLGGAMIWMGPSVARAGMISLRTGNILDAGQAVSPWQTFGQYARESQFVTYGTLLSIVLVLAMMARRVKEG